MSSARNHSKRSHRSEHFKRADVGASTRKMWVKQAQAPKRVSLYERFKNLFRRSNNAGN